MSGFSDANAFLAAPEVTAQYCPNPSTERGAGVKMSSHSSKPLIMYPSGRFVVIRDLENSGNVRKTKEFSKKHTKNLFFTIH
jgi:hypothetical protein